MTLSYTLTARQRGSVRRDVASYYRRIPTFWMTFAVLLGSGLGPALSGLSRNPSTWFVPVIWILAALIGSAAGVAVVVLWTSVPTGVAATVSGTGIAGTFDGRQETTPWNEVFAARDIGGSILIQRSRFRRPLAIAKSALADNGAALWSQLRRYLDPQRRGAAGLARFGGPFPVIANRRAR